MSEMKIESNKWKMVRMAQVLAFVFGLVCTLNDPTSVLVLCFMIIGEVNLIADTIIMINREDNLYRRLGTLVLIVMWPVWYVPYFFFKTQNKICAIIYGSAIGGVIGYIIHQFLKG